VREPREYEPVSGADLCASHDGWETECLYDTACPEILCQDSGVARCATEGTSTRARELYPMAALCLGSGGAFWIDHSCDETLRVRCVDPASLETP
jgi:hypothetical protein